MAWFAMCKALTRPGSRWSKSPGEVKLPVQSSKCSVNKCNLACFRFKPESGRTMHTWHVQWYDRSKMIGSWLWVKIPACKWKKFGIYKGEVKCSPPPPGGKWAHVYSKVKNRESWSSWFRYVLALHHLARHCLWWDSMCWIPGVLCLTGIRWHLDSQP